MKRLCNSLVVCGSVCLAVFLSGCGAAEEDAADTASLAQASSVPNQTIAPGVVVSADDYAGGRWLEVRNYSTTYYAEIKRYDRGKVVESKWVRPRTYDHIGRYSVYYDATVEAFTCLGGLCYAVHGSKYKVSALNNPNGWLPN